MEIIRYTKERKPEWDEFVENSKNGVFLFYRDYMEYHSDRFEDFSLLFFENNKLISILPANVKDGTLYSHAGLTFAGIVSDHKMKTPKMLEIFDNLKIYLKDAGIKKIVYKAVPHIYHTIPAEEDLYALFVNNAALIKRDVSSTLYINQKSPFSKGKKYCINKAKNAGLCIKQNSDFKTFMGIEKELLQSKYGKNPVHSAEEMIYLADNFSSNIKLFSAYKDEEMIAGIIVYESKNIAHAQYIASNNQAKDFGGVDLIVNYLINDYYKDKKYFDFGISTEQMGKYLNTGLIAQKEMFGARAVVYDTYEMQI